PAVCIPRSMNIRSRRVVLAMLAVIVAGCGSVQVPTPSASGSPAFLPLPSGSEITISSAGVAEHLAALQQIAQAHDGLRTVGTPGYTASVDYVVGQLRSFGYSVTTPVAEMSSFSELPGSRVDVEGGPSFAAGQDFHAMIYSGGGDLTAPVDEVTGGEEGCESSDFEGFQRGAIALVPPGGGCFRSA